MNLDHYVDELTRAACEASRSLALASTEQKNAALRQAAARLRQEAARLRVENEKDLDAGRQAGLTAALIDRLTLTDKRIESMAAGLEVVAELDDPVGEVFEEVTRPNGLRIQRVRVPLGVIVIIYESRPNVTADCAGLCLKAGSAAILRGGKEAMNSNRAIHQLLAGGAESAGIDPRAIQLVTTTDRSVIDRLVTAEDRVNLVIPRGGEGLIRAVVRAATVPVIKHYKGVCHVYVDQAADLAMAEAIAFNAKVQRPGVCNAMETLLVHESVAEPFLPAILRRLKEAGVELRGGARTRQLAPDVAEATEDDWSTEYLDLVLAVRVVASLDEAVDHIARYGSAHTDAIVTRDAATAEAFVRRVDSSSVMVNTTTRFSDGAEYGLGAEIGISTDKIHARGPMGLRELTSYKFVVRGEGQLRT